MTVRKYTERGQILVSYLDYAELQRQLTAYEATVTNLTAQVQGLAAENSVLKGLITYDCLVYDRVDERYRGAVYCIPKTPHTDAALAVICNEARAECLSGFVAFIKQRAKEFPQSVVADCLDVLINNVGQYAYSQQLRKDQGK